MGIGHSLAMNTLEKTSKISASVKIYDLYLSQQTFDNDLIQYEALPTANSPHYLHNIPLCEGQFNLLLVVSWF